MFTYSTIPRFKHCRSFINTILEVEEAVANYSSVRFSQDDVVASACLGYIQCEWQFKFNYP